MPIAKVYIEAAKLLGWRWSPTHNGFIHDAHIKSNCDRNNEGGYLVAFDSEDACFISGIETDKEAHACVKQAC